MIAFELFGVSFYLRFGFFASAALLCLLGFPRLTAISAAACIVHELGHIFAAVCFDIPIKSVTLWAGGVCMDTKSRLIPMHRELIMLMLGPTFNFAAALLLLHTGNDDAAAVNIMLGGFNLLPFSELDGGSMIGIILESRISDPRPILRALAAVTAALLTAAFLIFGIKNITLYMTAALLLAKEFGADSR